MDETNPAEGENELLGHVDAARREWLRKVLVGAAYAAPAVASFALTGLSANEAHAYTTNL
jgi:hypothetical protein